MMLLRRRPREVYRVYSEEEYLNGAGSELASIDEWQLGETPVGESPLSIETGRQGAGVAHRLHRMVGVAMLAAAMGTVGGVVFLNVAQAHSGAGARGSLLAATHSSRVARSPAINDAQPQVGSSRPAAVHSGKTTPRSRVVHVRRSLGGPIPRRSNHLLIHRLVRPHADVAVVADYRPRPSGEVSTTTASVSAPPVREKRAEFGFER
jgi:hypothetical protein